MEHSAQSAFVQELQRLVDASRAAIRAKDADAMEDAAHAIQHFLRMNQTGRLQEYFDTREARRETAGQDGASRIADDPTTI